MEWGIKHEQGCKALSGADRYNYLANFVTELAQKDVPVTELVTIRYELNSKHGFRVSDFNQIYKKEHEKYLRLVRELEEAQKKESAKSKLRSQAVILADIHSKLRRITSTSGDMIEIVLAAIISIRTAIVNRLPLFWLFIVDVPSGDKTSHLMMFEPVPFITFRDSITSGSFGSGYVDPRTGKGVEKDFLKDLDKGCLICKDMSAQFSMRSEKVKEFNGIMTNLYDQQFKKQTGTRGETGVDKCAFSLVAGITNEALDKHHRHISLLGPRFFMYRQDPLTPGQERKGFQLLWNSVEMQSGKEELRLLCSAYALQLYEKPDEFYQETSLSSDIRLYIEKLSKLQARLRGYCRREKEEFVLYENKDAHESGSDKGFKVQIEKPFRAMQQLRTCAISLTRIHNRRVITDHEMELLRRVVLGSGPNDRVSVLALYRNKHLAPDGKLTATVCANAIGRKYNRAKEILLELEALEILEKHDSSAGCQDKHYWTPKGEFFDIITKPYIELDHIRDLESGGVA